MKGNADMVGNDGGMKTYGWCWMERNPSSTIRRKMSQLQLSNNKNVRSCCSCKEGNVGQIVKEIEVDRCLELLFTTVSGGLKICTYCGRLRSE